MFIFINLVKEMLCNVVDKALDDSIGGFIQEVQRVLITYEANACRRSGFVGRL